MIMGILLLCVWKMETIITILDGPKLIKEIYERLFVHWTNNTGYPITTIQYVTWYMLVDQIIFRIRKHTL